jgi:hypothetical protein
VHVATLCFFVSVCGCAALLAGGAGTVLDPNSNHFAVNNFGAALLDGFSPAAAGHLVRAHFWVPDDRRLRIYLLDVTIVPLLYQRPVQHLCPE